MQIVNVDVNVCHTEGLVVKTERYTQWLTQGYSAREGSYSWAPDLCDGVFKYRVIIKLNFPRIQTFPANHKSCMRNFSPGIENGPSFKSYLI